MVSVLACKYVIVYAVMAVLEISKSEKSWEKFEAEGIEFTVEPCSNANPSTA